MKRVLVTAGILLGCVLVICLLIPTILKPSVKSLPTVPNPNAYDLFVKAGSATTRSLWDASEMKIDGLRDLIASNSQAVKLCQSGFSNQFRIPTANLLTNFSSSGADLIALKSVAFLLSAQSRLALLEGRTNDAIEVGVNGLRFGNEVGRGGFLIHRLVGIACETIAMKPLITLSPQLENNQRLVLIHSLEQLETQSVQWNEIVENERLFERNQAADLRNLFGAIREWRTTRNAINESEGKHNVAVAWRRLLLADLAVRAYQADHGSAPQNLEELVPKYLRHIPQDPFAAGPLSYRRQGTNWLLYSIGSDHKDDGGKPATNAMPGFGFLPTESSSDSSKTVGDLFLTTPW